MSDLHERIRAAQQSAGEREVILDLHNKGMCSVVPGSCWVCEEGEEVKKKAVNHALRSLENELHRAGMAQYYSSIVDAIDNLIKARLKWPH